MTQQAPAVWPQQPPPGAPPGTRVPPSPEKRRETLGTVCLVLSILELLYCGYKLLSPLLSRGILDAEKAMFDSLPRGPAGNPMNPVMDAAATFMARIAVWEAVRTLPFVVATGFLLWIAVRLRRGDAGALGAARTWMPFALGAVAVSALIQGLVTVPATIDYQRHVVNLMPAMPSGAGAPFDVKAMTSAVTMVSAIAGMAMGTLFLSVWPVVLYVWAGRLMRDAARAEPGAAAP